MRIKFTFFFLFSLFVLKIASAQMDYETRKMNFKKECFDEALFPDSILMVKNSIQGIYHAGDSIEGNYLYLLNDTIFIHDYYFYSDYKTEKYPGALFKTVKGTYIFNRDHLILNPIEYSKYYMYVDDTIPFLMENDRYYASNAIEIKTDFVRMSYDGQSFLLSDQRIGRLDRTSDFLDFCNDVNAGDLSEITGSYFVKIEGSQPEKSERSALSLPKYAHYMLEKPVELLHTGHTKEIEVDETFDSDIEVYFFENVDERLQEGMLIHGAESGCIVRIIRILEGSALGVIENQSRCNCRQGEVLSTRKRK